MRGRRMSGVMRPSSAGKTEAAGSLTGLLRFNDSMTRKAGRVPTTMSSQNIAKAQLGREDVLKQAIADAIAILTVFGRPRDAKKVKT